MAKSKPVKHAANTMAPKKYVPPLAQRGLTAPTPPISSAEARRHLRGY